MKKSYQKPELYYEDFALQESIAGCDLLSNFNEVTGCVAYKLEAGGPFGDLWVYADATQGCTTTPQNPGANECYGNPTPGFSIFSS